MALPGLLGLGSLVGVTCGDISERLFHSEFPLSLQPHHENPGHRDGPEDEGQRRRVNPKSSKEGESTWGSRSLWTWPLEQGRGSPTRRGASAQRPTGTLRPLQGWAF